VCGDSPCCTCRPLSAPSPGWRPRALRPLFWRDLLLVVEIVVDAVQRAVTPRFDAILKEIHTMAGQTQAAAAELVKDLHRLADGYSAKDALLAAKDAEIGELRAALASADADKEAAVASAVDAQDAAGAAAINEADAIVENLSPEPVDTPPADSGDGSAPVENPPAEGGDSSAPVE
jgi:hypothetical protein